MRPNQVRRKHRAPEPKRGVVGPLERLLLGLEGGDDDKGAEDFLLEDAHVVLDVGEDGGGDEEALAVGGLVGLATVGEGSAFGFA